jgi:hypothetical protein
VGKADPLHLLSWTGDGVHLSADFVEEGHAVVAFFVEVEVGSVVDVGKVRVGVQGFQDGFEFVGSAVEIERVCGADDEVEFAL